MANPTTNSSSKLNSSAPNFSGQIAENEKHLEKLAQDTGKRIGEVASDIANTTADSLKNGREYIKDNPVKGIAYAAAAGVVAGSLLTVLMRSSRH